MLIQYADYNVMFSISQNKIISKNISQYICLILTILIISTQAKLFSKEFKSSNIRTQKSWIYLDRMRFGSGEAAITFQANLQASSQPALNRYKLTLQIIPQNLWDIHRVGKCQSKSEPVDNGTKRETIELYFNVEGELKNKSTITIPITEPITYYFVLSDCDKSMVNQYFNKKSKFNVRIDRKNNGNNQAADESALNWLIPLLLLIYSFWIYKLNQKSQIFIEYKQNEQIDWPKLITKIIIWSQITALAFFELGHLIYVYGEGNKHHLFSFIYLLSGTLAETILLIFITFCSYGWMTTFLVTEDETEQIFYPIASVMGFISIVLSLLSKINDDDIDKTHIYDSLAIDIQIVLKCIGLCTFCIGLVRFKLKYGKSKGLMIYLLRLTLYGIFCYCGGPLLILCQEGISKHYRQGIILISSQVIKVIELSILAFEMRQKSSTYNKISLHNKSFMEVQNKYL